MRVCDIPCGGMLNTPYGYIFSMVICDYWVLLGIILDSVKV